MAITDKTELKAKAEEYTAVANAIRILMGQPQFDSTNYTNKYAYIWTTDYVAKLTQLKTILERLNNIIGDDESTENRYFIIDDGEWVEIYPTAEELEEATTESIDVDPVDDQVSITDSSGQNIYIENVIYILDNGPVEEIKEKIEEVQERINDIIDPNHEETDETINGAIDEVEGLINRLDDIVDGDPTQSTGQTPSELIENIEGNKTELEEIVDPNYDPTTDDRPLDDVVNDIKDAIDSIRNDVPDPDSDPEADPAEPDERTIDEVAEDVADLVDQKEELQDLINKIKEIIHQVAVYTEEEDPNTYYVVVDGEWEPIDESQIDPSIYTEEAEIDFQPAEGDEAGQDYNDYTVYSFTETRESADEYFDNKAEEIYELMEEEDLDWEDLTDDQKLIIVIDDLLDYIESLEAEVEEYRNGGFELIETSSTVTGSGIFRTITRIEEARRLSMSEEQKEAENTVMYVSRALFHANESFLCAGLINGVRRNGAFFYREGDEDDTVFHTVSTPTSDARIEAGKYLIRVILYQMVYYYELDEDSQQYVWKVIKKHLAKDRTIINVPTKPEIYNTRQEFENDSSLFTAGDTVIIAEEKKLYKKDNSNNWILLTTDTDNKYFLLRREVN